ncbi:hypothetical protein GCM10020000_01300 [Streptomyces olivoverticillatus]
MIQETVISDEASVPNCRCTPSTPGAPSRCGLLCSSGPVAGEPNAEAGAAAASPAAPTTEAAAAAEEPLSTDLRVIAMNALVTVGGR